MKHLLLGLLTMPLASWAHQTDVLHSPWSQDTLTNSCRVVELPSYVFPKAMQRSMSPFSVPSISPDEDVADAIFDTEHDYVYRLAICVGPAYITDVWKGNLDAAREWLQGTSDFLNTVYSRDLGIRFDIVMDDRLFLAEYPDGYDKETFCDDNGTIILNNLIGKDAYDVGILIRPKTQYLAGQASLGGAYTPLHKGNAMATINEHTIAHELGHMFGAKHTHVVHDGLCLEPGQGQTIMSYGEPRVNFSLATATVVRRQLKSQKYYLNKDRKPEDLVGGELGNMDNPPYIVPNGKTKPQLDRSKIRQRYTITRGTRFQFNIPVANPQSSFTYSAQSCDDAIFGFDTNELQPAYPFTEKPYVMFQPYYDEGRRPDGVQDAILVPFSDNYRVGRFSFLLAAADGPRYDAEKVYLNIVEGKPFQITSTFDWQVSMGRDIKLKWYPCTEIYGKDSKVRISLSDDFGQTYKYVLDDLVPNTGEWQGSWPFVNVGRVYYRNFSKPIRGGVIKVEVIGEAAYAVSKEKPDEANPTMLYSGGFEIIDASSYIRFRKGNAPSLPEPYLRVQSEEQVPEKFELEAYHKNGAGSPCKVACVEVREQNVIRRKWTASINGVSGTYSQLIIIEDPSLQERDLLEDHAYDLKPMADDLCGNKGELGYPLPSVKDMNRLNDAYAAVFTPEGKVQPQANQEKVDTLRSILNQICQAGDKEIYTPQHHHYYTLRNYQDIFGRESYYYLGEKQNPEDNNGFSADASRAMVWRCNAIDGKFSFYDAQGKSMELEGFITPGENEEMTLDRGYTWGSFTLVNRIKACAQLSQKATYFSRNVDYHYDPKGYRTNSNSTVSTDFQFVPVDFIEACKPGTDLPWNVLQDKQQFILDDTYSHLFVGKDVTIEQLQYTRQFTNTEWQTLYLPFDSKCSNWTEHCEVAHLDDIQVQTSGAVATYVVMTDGVLKANQPYLIRAKQTGTHTFILGKVTVKPTEETVYQIGSSDFAVKGNYGVVSANGLQTENGYVLQGDQFTKADGNTNDLPSMRWYITANATGSSTPLPQNILLVEKGEQPVGTLSIETQEGYGTIYTDKSYVMPLGVIGYYVSDVDVDNHEMVLTEAYYSGATVPAGIPLLVKGEKRTYLLYAPKTEAADNTDAPVATNMLMGTVAESMTEAPNGQSTDAYLFYSLSYGDNNSNVDGQSLGFYWEAPDGAPFTNAANKAYLTVAKEKAGSISGFVMPGNGTVGIYPTESVDKDVEIYTISGIRLSAKAVSSLKPGIYIVNGKKIVVK